MKLKISLLISLILSLGANVFLTFTLLSTNEEINKLQQSTSLFSKFPINLEVRSRQVFGGGQFELISAFNALDAKSSSIWIYNRESGVYHKIAQSLSYTIFSSPKISPDEQHLAFMQIYPFAVKVINLDDNFTEVIYTESHPDSILAPSISKNYETSLSWIDNRTLVFENNRDIDLVKYSIDIFNRNISEFSRIKSDVSKPNILLEVEHFSQRDSKWAGEKLGGCEKHTIDSAGCAVASLAMVSNFYGTRINPSEMNQIFSENSQQGYFNGCDVKWYIPTQLNDNMSLKWAYFNEFNLDRVHAELNSGNPVIIGFNSVPFTRVQHWVVITGYENGKYIINDPWDSSANSKTLEDFGGRFDHMIVFSPSS